jgi:hypothetical protein
MGEPVSLEFSIPANNQKIIEVYNKIRSGQLSVNKDYQRKLVWKKQHKFNFVDTILRNYPFPEVYLTPGALDQEKLILIDEIVDGQQRLTTIRDYIEDLDVFALPKIPVPKFSELDIAQRTAFLNYEVSVRYLKNVTHEQVRDIFQRINKTDYALNASERLNAQWGDSEFVCFAKQLFEPGFQSDSVVYIMEEGIRNEFLEFFHGKGDDDDDQNSVFSETDMSRMLALQYMMTLVATLDLGEYFNRNDKIKSYIEGYNDSFPQAEELTDRLITVVRFINKLEIRRFSRWFNKANLFTLIIELDKFDLESIDHNLLSVELVNFDLKASLDELKDLLGDEPQQELTKDEVSYLFYSRESVNQRAARELRAKFVSNIISSCLTDD